MHDDPGSVAIAELHGGVGNRSHLYEEAMRAGGGEAAERIAIACLADGFTVAALYEQVIAPAMARIGELWELGEITIVVEHLASALNLKVMASVYAASLPHKPAVDHGASPRRREGDRHGVGLRMAGDVLELAGFEVLYLGEDVSSDDLILAVSARRSRRDRAGGPDGGRPRRSRGRRSPSSASASPMSRSSSADRALPAAWRAPMKLCGPRPSPSCPPSWTAWSPGARLEARPRWSDPTEMLPPASRGGRETLPEDRLLEIAAESAEAARAHARVANAYRRLAFEDPLTGVPNRRAFDERIAQLTGEEVDAMLLMIDLDGFKQVNDSFGHAEGDRVLQRVARLIDRERRTGDFAARLGGDEFAVLLPLSRPDEARALATRSSPRSTRSSPTRA